MPSWAGPWGEDDFTTSVSDAVSMDYVKVSSGLRSNSTNVPVQVHNSRHLRLTHSALPLLPATSRGAGLQMQQRDMNPKVSEKANVSSIQ